MPILPSPPVSSVFLLRQLRVFCLWNWPQHWVREIASVADHVQATCGWAINKVKMHEIFTRNSVSWRLIRAHISEIEIFVICVQYYLRKTPGTAAKATYIDVWKVLENRRKLWDLFQFLSSLYEWKKHTLLREITTIEKRTSSRFWIDPASIRMYPTTKTFKHLLAHDYSASPQGQQVNTEQTMTFLPQTHNSLSSQKYKLSFQRRQLEKRLMQQRQILIAETETLVHSTNTQTLKTIKPIDLAHEFSSFVTWTSLGIIQN